MPTNPEIYPIPDEFLCNGISYSHDLSATIGGNPLTSQPWSFVGSVPSGMIISPNNANNASISWTPNQYQVGDFTITIKVTDTSGNYHQETFTITINSAPVITSVIPTGLICCSCDDEFSTQVVATDINGNLLQSDQLHPTNPWSLLNAPPGMVITNDGIITWIPVDNTTESGDVTIRVIDACGQYSDLVFNIPVNAGPEIISLAPTELLVQTFPFIYNPVASDREPNLLTEPWSLLEPIPQGMTINQISGQVTWVPSITQVGDFPICIRVTDICSVSDTQCFVLTVLPFVENPPDIDTEPPSEICDCNEFVYEAYVKVGTGTSPFTWSLLNAPTGMVVNPATGRVTWTPGLCPDGNSVGGHSGHSDGHSASSVNSLSGGGSGGSSGHSGGHSHDLCCGGIFTSGLVELMVTDSLGGTDIQTFSINVCQCIDFIPVEGGHSHGHSEGGHSHGHSAGGTMHHTGHSHDTHNFHGHKMRSNLTPSGSYIQLTGNVYDIPAKFMICEEPLNTHGNTTFNFLNKTFHITSTGPSILNKPLLLVIKYTDAELSAMGPLDENRLKGLVWNPTTNTWTYLKTEVDLSHNTAEIEINQLVGGDYNLSKVLPVPVEINNISLSQTELESLKINVKFDSRDIDMDGIQLVYKWKLASQPDSLFKIAKVSPPLNRISGTGDWITYSILWDVKKESIFKNNNSPQQVVFRVIANDDDGTTTTGNSSVTTILLSAPAPTPFNPLGPKIKSKPKTNVNIGDIYIYEPKVDNAIPAAYWQQTGKPNFLTFNSATGKLSGTPLSTNIGTWVVTLKAFSALNVMNSQVFTITIKNK